MQSDILDQLQQHSIISDTNGWTVRSASGGLNSEVYLAINPSGKPKFTLRHSKNSHILNQEAQVLKRLGNCAGVPQNVDMLTGSILVHTYLPGQPKPLTEVGKTGIANLALLLACIHQHRADWFAIWPSTNRMAGSRADAFHARLQTLTHYRTFQEPLDRSFHERIVAVYRRLLASDLTGTHWQQRTFQQLHGDLSYGNIIWDGDSVGLVDWEYARVGDAAEDIAYLLTEQPPENWQVEALKTHYLDSTGDPALWNRVQHYLPLTALDASLWWMDHLASIGVDPVNHHEVLRRLEQAENRRTLP